MLSRWLSIALLVVIPCLSVSSQPRAAAGAPAPGSVPLLGYSRAGSLTEAGWEEKFRAGISPSNIRENMRRLSARPHHVGSPYDKDNAEWILARFKEWGFDAKIETSRCFSRLRRCACWSCSKPTKFRASCRSLRSRGSHVRPDLGAAADL